MLRCAIAEILLKEPCGCYVVHRRDGVTEYYACLEHTHTHPRLLAVQGLSWFVPTPYLVKVMRGG